MTISRGIAYHVFGLALIHFTTIMLIVLLAYFLDLPNCGNPGRPENAVLIDRNHWAGEYVRYLCHPGYTMFGPAVRRCLPSGKWSGNAVQCKNLITRLKFSKLGGENLSQCSYKCQQMTSSLWSNSLWAGSTQKTVNALSPLQRGGGAKRKRKIEHAVRTFTHPWNPCGSPPSSEQILFSPAKEQFWIRPLSIIIHFLRWSIQHIKFT